MRNRRRSGLITHDLISHGSWFIQALRPLAERFSRPGQPGRHTPSSGGWHHVWNYWAQLRHDPWSQGFPLPAKDFTMGIQARSASEGIGVVARGGPRRVNSRWSHPPRPAYRARTPGLPVHAEFGQATRRVRPDSAIAQRAEQRYCTRSLHRRRLRGLGSALVLLLEIGVASLLAIIA